MEVESGEGQLQIHLRTKQKEYAIPDTPYSIRANVKSDELNVLVNSILREDTLQRPIEFDFLVFGEILSTRLGEHLKEKSISFEDIIEIEYFERFPSPEPQECLLHDDWVSAVQTRNKWILTGCYDNTINIWTIKGSHVLTIPGHTSPIKAVAWVSLNEKTGVFVSCSQDQTAMLWEWNIEENAVDCVFVCKGHERGIDSVDISPDQKRFATGSWDTMLKIWSTDVRNEDGEGPEKRFRSDVGATKTPLMTLQGHRECISGVQWMDSDTILTCSWDHTMKVWDLNLEGIKNEITGNKSFFDMSYSRFNNLIITASADKSLRLYDPRSNKGSVVKSTFLGHTQWVQTVMWSPEDEYHFVSGSYDNSLKLWDSRSTRVPLYDFFGHSDKVLDIDWSNPKYITSGGQDNTVRVYRSDIRVEKEK